MCLFIFTLSKNKLRRRKAFIIVFSAILAAALIFCVFILYSRGNFAGIDGRRLDIRIKGDDDIERISGFFDISINKDTIAKENIKIPEKFNKMYEKYNSLQKNIGTDLSDYKGKECVKYTADIISGTSDTIITLLAYDGRFIGGDISSKEFDGKIYALL